MNDKVFETDFAAFCGLFGSLSVEQATAKAKEMGLDIVEDYGLVDINYKHICATVSEDGVDISVECWDDEGCYVKTIQVEQHVIDALSQR